MAIKTRSLGNNVSVVTYSLGTTLPELVSAINREIIRRVEIDGRFISAHGWELLEELSSLDRVYRSLCADGKTFKYLRMVFTESSLTLFSYTDWSLATSSGADEIYLPPISDIDVNFSDRGNFFIFANPRWLAFSAKQYGSPILLNSDANGVVGIFETEAQVSDSFGNLPPFCLLCTALIGGDFNSDGYVIPGLPTQDTKVVSTSLGDFVGNGVKGIVPNLGEVTFFGQATLPPAMLNWYSGHSSVYIRSPGLHRLELTTYTNRHNSIYKMAVSDGKYLGWSYSPITTYHLSRGVLDLVVGMWKDNNNSETRGFRLRVINSNDVVVFDSADNHEAWRYVRGDLSGSNTLIRNSEGGNKISTIFGTIDPESPNPNILPSEHNPFSGSGWAMPVVLMSRDNKLIGRVYGLKFGTRNKDFFLDKVHVDCDENYWNAHEDSVSIPTDHAIIPSGLGANGVTSARYLLPF